VNGWPVLDKDDIEERLDAFSTKSHANLALLAAMTESICRMTHVGWCVSKVCLTGRTSRSGSSL